MKSNFRITKTREIKISSFKDGNFKLKSGNPIYIAWDWVYKNIFKRFNAIFIIFVWYLTFVIVGGLLLWSPSTHVSSAQRISFIDALFMSASAFSDTGLATVILVEQFNIWGQVVVFFLIVIGGIGWFTIKIFFLSLIIRKGMTWKNKKQLAQESGADIKTAVGIALTAALTTFFAIIVFGTTIGIMLHYIEPIDSLVDKTTYDPINNFGQSMWTGYFLAGSAINNAGLDNIGGYSLMAYYNSESLQFIIMFLFVLGGMGFGIIYDFGQYIKNKWKGTKFRFSLLTKVSMFTYLFVAISGLMMVYMFEFSSYYNDPTTSFLGKQYVNGDSLNYGTFHERLVAIAFNTMSTRNAGFSTIDLNSLSDPSIGTYSAMMFIGSGPGSTAGGIRTTTLFVVFISIIQYARGKERVTAFNRNIPRSTVKDSLVLALVSLFLVFMFGVILQAFEMGNTIGQSATSKGISYRDALFIAVSAFGTTGLSTVEIAGLTNWSKGILMFIMFIGQLGVLQVIKMFNSKNKLISGRKKALLITENLPVG